MQLCSALFYFLQDESLLFWILTAQKLSISFYPYLGWRGGGGDGLIFTQCEIKKKVNPVVLCIWIFEFSHNLNLNVYAVNMHHILNCHKSWKLKRYLLVHKPYVASPSAMKLSLAFRVLTAHWQCTSMRLLSGSYGSLNAKLWSGPNLTLFYPVVINETELY